MAPNPIILRYHFGNFVHKSAKHLNDRRNDLEYTLNVHVLILTRIRFHSSPSPYNSKDTPPYVTGKSHALISTVRPPRRVWLPITYA